MKTHFPHPLPRLMLAGCVLLLGASLQAQTLRPSNRPLGLPNAGAVPTQRIAQSGPLPADFIVVVVNSEPITNNELRLRVLRAEQQLTQQGVAIPPRNELASRMIDLMINERAQLQVARETGVRVDEGMIDQAMQTVAQQNQITVDVLRRRLQADGLSLQQFRNDLRDQLLLSRLREREVESRTRITDQEADQFIREQQTAGSAVTELNLAQILVAVPEKANEAQVTALRARAQRVLERAQKGDDFTALSAEFSDAPDKRQGGQLGLRPADRYPDLFTEAVRNVAVGGIAGPVRSGAGFHVLKVLEKKQSSTVGDTVLQTRARHILMRPTPTMNEAAVRARLAQMRQQVREGKADFAALAKEFSADGSAASGGDLGWANPGQFVPEFEVAMETLAPGQIAEPVTSRFGVHLIQVVERRQAKLTQSQQRELARAALREKKQDEAYTQWAQEVRGRAYVEFREAPL